jgi:hypothetical protein
MPKKITRNDAKKVLRRMFNEARRARVRLEVVERAHAGWLLRIPVLVPHSLSEYLSGPDCYPPDLEPETEAAPCSE